MSLYLLPCLLSDLPPATTGTFSLSVRLMQDVDAKSQSEINSILAFLPLAGTSSILVLNSTHELQTINTELPVSSNNNSIVNKLFRRLPTSSRGHAVAVIGNPARTFFFLFFAFSGAQTANVASSHSAGTTVITVASQKTPAQFLYISLFFGFALVATP